MIRMVNWRFFACFIAASLALAAMGAWLQEFLPRDTVPEVSLMWGASLLAGYAVALTHGSRAWLLASLVLLFAPFVAGQHELALLVDELRNSGLSHLLVIPSIVTAAVLSWPVIVLSFAWWAGRTAQARRNPGPDAFTPWRVPCAAACLLVFAGLQAFTFFPEYTTRRVGAWRTIEQRVDAAVVESQRVRAELGLADKAILDATEDARVRAQLTPIEPVRFPFATRPTSIKLARLTPHPRFRLDFGAGREAEFEAETLICRYID